MDPQMMDLKAAYQKKKPGQPPDVNPTSQDHDTYFMSPDLLPEGYKCQVGDELLVRMAVKSKGSKIGLTPVEVVKEESPEGEEEEAGEEEEDSDRMPG